MSEPIRPCAWLKNTQNKQSEHQTTIIMTSANFFFSISLFLILVSAETDGEIKKFTLFINYVTYVTILR
jgi:hypothetical protein